MPKLLIVDDEPNLLYSLKKVLRTIRSRWSPPKRPARDRQGSRAEAGRRDSRRPACRICRDSTPFRKWRDRFAVAGHHDHGLFDDGDGHRGDETRGLRYLLKPVAFDQLRATVQRALQIRHGDLVVRSGRRGRRPASTAGLMIGQSPAMQEVYKAIGRIAPQDVTVLIEGESGVGKEFVAQVIYHYSRRSQGPFLAINCAAIPESLLESELFGHERGAFTGAADIRIGKFQQVDGGTLFLDEIGDMPLSAQAKMLRVLQDGSFERVGSNKTLRANVRVIAATNQNLGRTRRGGIVSSRSVLSSQSVCDPDSRHCASGWTISPLLLDYFIRLFNQELGNNVRARFGRRPCKFSSTILGRGICASCKVR